MTSYPRWKYIMVILVLMVSVIYSLPNIYTSYPALEVSNADKVDLVQINNIIDPAINPEDVIKEGNKFIFKFSDSKIS